MMMMRCEGGVFGSSTASDLVESDDEEISLFGDSDDENIDFCSEMKFPWVTNPITAVNHQTTTTKYPKPLDNFTSRSWNASSVKSCPSMGNLSSKTFPNPKWKVIRPSESPESPESSRTITLSHNKSRSITSSSMYARRMEGPLIAVCNGKPLPKSEPLSEDTLQSFINSLK
jgi:hypothetical protein